MALHDEHTEEARNGGESAATATAQRGQKRYRELEGTDLASRLKSFRDGGSQRSQGVKGSQDNFRSQSNNQNQERSAPRPTGVGDVLREGGYRQGVNANAMGLDSSQAVKLAEKARGEGTSAFEGEAQPSKPASARKHQRLERSSLPIDWCLKTSVRFLSGKSFQGFANPRADQRDHALESFMFPANRLAQVADRCQRALLSCVHPGEQWRPELVAACKASDFASWRARVERWREAFASAFFALRSGRGDALYCIFENHFVALFSGPSVRSEEEPTVVLSRSSPSLRDALRKRGVNYSLPLAPSHRMPNEEAVNELRAMEAERPGSTHSVAVGNEGPVASNSASLLRAEGAEDVHLVFCCLREYFTVDSTVDVPCILSPCTFQYGMLRPMELTCKRRERSEQAEEVPGVNVRGEEGRQVVYSAEVEGTVPPWVLSRLAEVFRDSHKDFRIEARTLDVSTGLNIRLTGLQEQQGRGGPCVGYTERDLLHEAPFFEGGALHQVDCCSGRYIL